jgi:hypothetical protein
LTRKSHRKTILKAIDSVLLDLGEEARHAILYHVEINHSIRLESIPDRIEDFQEALTHLLGVGANAVERLIAQNLYNRLGLNYAEHENWTLSAYVEAATQDAMRVAVGAHAPCYVASVILCLEGHFAAHYRVFLLLYILVAFSYRAGLVGTAQAAATTYFPSSSNILTGSFVSGDMTSLVNVDSNYYVVRSASSATTTVSYNPSAHNLLGSTSLVSGAVSDLVSDNGVYMTFRSYASQTSTISLGRAAIGYRSNTGAFTTSSPKGRSWDGSVWEGTESELSTAGSPIRWVRAAYSPLMARYYEEIIVTLSNDGYLDAYVWTGSSWSVTNDIGFVGTTANDYRPFDIAYEKTSGKAMLVYGISSTDPAKDLAYRTWDGSSWSAEGYINDSGHDTDIQYRWVNLASKPTTGANEISLIACEGSTTYGSVRAWIWDGTSWGNELGLETRTIKTKEHIGVSYESISGNAVFVWGYDSASPPRGYESRRWLGSTWEGTERLVTNSISGDPGWVTLKSDPATNRIMFLTVDSLMDLWTVDWNPTTWTTHTVHDTDVDFAGDRCADGDWEPTASKYLMVYGTVGGSVAMKTWTAASGWSGVGSVTAASTHDWIQLRRNPRDVAGDVKILGAMLNSNYDIGALKWDGTTLTNIGDSTFTAGVGTKTYECFDLRFQVLGDPTEFTSEVEFTGSSNNYRWAQLVWTVDSAWTAASVTATIQLYNYNSASYSSSGDGYVSYTSSATPNTDETRTQTITANPQNFRDAGGNWKIKIKGVKTTSTQFDFKADWIEYKTAYYSEYTASTEFIFSGITSDTLTLLVFRVVSQHDIAPVSVTIQVWSYNAGQYVTSGEGYLTYTSSATPSTDETTILAITANPSHYVSSGSAKIKVTGVKATVTQFQQKANQIKLDTHSPVTTTVLSTIPTTVVTTVPTTVVSTVPTTIVRSTTAVMTTTEVRTQERIVTVTTITTVMGLEHVTHTVISTASTTVTSGATLTILATTTGKVTTSVTASTTSTTTTTMATTLVTTTTETFTPLLFQRCVIASAAYGSELAPEVQFLRVFRDQVVASTFAGGVFMKVFNSFYYSFSPAAASVVAENPVLSQIIRLLLYPLIAALRISSTIFYALSFWPQFAVIASGTLASALIGAAYLTPPIAVLKIWRTLREISGAD